MTSRRASELILAADFSGSGTFSAVGAVREPSFALSVAVKDLLTHRENPELKPVVVHVLATRIAGVCSIASPSIWRALTDCLAARLVLEWKITIPAIGSVCALFLVTRLEKADQPDLCNLALQLASRPSFDAAQPQAVAPPRRFGIF